MNNLNQKEWALAKITICNDKTIDYVRDCVKNGYAIKDVYDHPNKSDNKIVELLVDVTKEASNFTNKKYFQKKCLTKLFKKNNEMGYKCRMKKNFDIKHEKVFQIYTSIF